MDAPSQHDNRRGSAADKRSMERWELPPVLRVYDADSSTLLGRIGDINEGGMRIVSEDAVLPGKAIRVSLEVPLDKGRIGRAYVEGRTQWTRLDSDAGCWNVGVCFQRGTEASVQRIEQFVRDIKRHGGRTGERVDIENPSSKEKPMLPPALARSLAARAKRVRMAKSSVPQGMEMERAELEGFPHVAAKITALWGHPACIDYLRGMIFCDRDNRRGFPEKAFAELMFLFNLLTSFAEFYFNETLSDAHFALYRMQEERRLKERLMKMSRYQ